MMDTGTTTTETWALRVRAWRASGKRAEEFIRGEGYAASTLRWWASKLKLELPAAPEVRLARVVRTVGTAPSPALSPPIVIDVTSAGARVAVGLGADRETLAMVVDVLRSGAPR
ncbi:MAG: hypothetical protein WKG01_22885 [Kofleriaceae bacterium]